jgi:phage terminase large subunit
MSEAREIRVQIPRAFEFLWSDARYIVAWGGRGSGKSVNIGRVLLLRGLKERHRILCVRELQGSIKESVHQLLKDEIEALGLGWFYKVYETSIRGANGTEFLFKGLRFNAAEIKSMHGVSLVWCEEARVISKNSWDVLLPTIRVEGSQFWLSFNPELETDFIYKHFVVGPPRPTASLSRSAGGTIRFSRPCSEPKWRL